MNKYYVISTEENDEFNTRNRIKKLYPLLDIVIPIEKTKIEIENKNFITFTRLMPDYILTGTEELTTEQMNRLNKVKGVIQVLSDRINGALKPTPIEKNEVRRFVGKKYDTIISESFKENSYVNILTGQYAGFLANIKKINGDEISVVIRIKHSPEITLPVWAIGKEEVK